MDQKETKKSSRWRIIGRIAVGSIQVSNILLVVLLALAIIAVIAILLADRYVANSFYSSQIINFIIENGIRSPIFFPASWISRFSLTSIFSFIVICIFLIGIKILLKKIIKKLRKVATNWRILLASIMNMLVNVLLLGFALIVFINVIFVGYINNTFGTLFSESPSGYQYTEKVSLIEEQLNNQKTAANLALSKLINDVSLGVIDLDKLSDEEYIHLGLEASQLIDLKGGVSSANEHYFRNRFSRAPATLDDMVDTILNHPEDPYKWELMPIDSALFHMNGKDGEYNLKFVSSDGHFEAVYNKDGKLLTEWNSPANMGTFNYADPFTEKGKHSGYDVLPYFRWTNTPIGPPVNDHILEKAQEQYDNNQKAQIRYETYKTLLEKK